MGLEICNVFHLDRVCQDTGAVGGGGVGRRNQSYCFTVTESDAPSFES